jgi:host factor-I protein
MPFRSSPLSSAAAAKKGRTPPPEETYQESQYLKQLGEKQKIVNIKLCNGEVVRGWIEYYDKNMVRLTREGAPNLFIFKHDILYIAEEGQPRRSRTDGARAEKAAVESFTPEEPSSDGDAS